MTHEAPMQMAITVGGELPIVAVLYHERDEDAHPSDAGYSILFSDAPEDGGLVDDDACRPACLCCVIEEWPEVGKGMDLARQYGEAERDPKTGEWFVSDAAKAEAA